MTANRVKRLRICAAGLAVCAMAAACGAPGQPTGAASTMVAISAANLTPGLDRSPTVRTPSSPIVSATISVGPSSSAPAQTSPSTSPTQIPTSQTGTATTVLLHQTAWYAGVRFQITGASFDPVAAKATISALLSNTSEIGTGPGVAEFFVDPADGSGLIPVRRVAPDELIAGTTSAATLEFDVPGTFKLLQARLILGKPGDHQWVVPLREGAAATGESPVLLHRPGPLATSSGMHFDITSAQLLPWTCNGIPPHTLYLPADKATSVLALHGTAGATAAGTGGNAIDSMSVTAPDGTTAAAIAVPAGVWRANESTTDEVICLPVPAREPGTYRLTLTGTGGSTATEDIVVPG